MWYNSFIAQTPQGGAAELEKCSFVWKSCRLAANAAGLFSAPGREKGEAGTMTRREAREQAFCLVFEQAVGGEKMEDILHDATEARDFVPGSYAEEAAFGVEERQAEIDQVIQENIRGWSFARLSKVTLALLRLAVYEMLFDESIPASVSINEAVELAKTYGGKDDAPYINGVLASVAKAHCPDEPSHG